MPALLGVEPRLRLLRLGVGGEEFLLDRGELLGVAALATRRERELPLEVVAALRLRGELTRHDRPLLGPLFPLGGVLALGGLQVQVLLVVRVLAALRRQLFLKLVAALHLLGVRAGHDSLLLVPRFPLRRVLALDGLEVIALLHAGDADGGESRMRPRGIGDASLYDGLALRLHGARVVPTKRV